MPTSKPASVLSVENPVSLIRSRIKEKRIFEARFLCRQLGDTIGEREKTALEGELAGFLSRVDTLQQQARTLLTEGQKDRAFALYREMEAIAIDVPGLAEEKRALEGAAALAARLAVKTGEPAALPAVPLVPLLAEDEQDVPDPPPRNQRRKRGALIWITAGLLGVLLLLFLAWKKGKDALPPPPSPPPPAQKILIRPLVSASPAIAEQPEKEVEPAEATSETNVPPSPSLKLGTLQVEESGRR